MGLTRVIFESHTVHSMVAVTQDPHFEISPLVIFTFIDCLILMVEKSFRFDKVLNVIETTHNSNYSEALKRLGSVLCYHNLRYFCDIKCSKFRYSCG